MSTRTGPEGMHQGRTGRPRSPEADAAILAATRQALVELGWSKLTMGDVAARAGVAKTTLYRRWPSRNELVVDAVAILFDELRLPDLGSLAADVESVVRQFGALLERPEAKTALMAVIAEATRDDALRRRIRTAIVDRQKHLVVAGRERAQERGEIPPPPDPAAAARDTDLIFDVVAGAVVHRTLVSAEPVDGDWARRLTQLVLTGLTAQRTPAAGATGGPAAPVSPTAEAQAPTQGPQEPTAADAGS